MNLTGVMNDKNEDLLNQIVSLMQRDDSADAPADAVRWAKNLFRARAAEPKKSVVERVMAVLQLDLSPGSAAFGERSGAAGAARQLLFEAGGNAIDLRIAPVKKGFSLSGQLLGEDFAGAEVALDGAAASLTTAAGEMSEFAFASVPAGVYRLIVRSAEKEIVIENIEIV
jgi:hypothetical protein